MKRRQNLKNVFLPALVSASVMLFTMCRNKNVNMNTDLAIPVSLMDVKKGSIEKVLHATGTVNATRQALIKSEVAGKYILQKNPATGKPYKLGDGVRTGDMVVILADKEYENNLNIPSKKLNMDISRQEYEKQKSLYEKGGVTLRELRNSEISWINAKSDYENSLLRLEKMKARAPFNGIITGLPFYTPGVRINAGQDLFTVMQYDNLYMYINLPERYLPEVKPGQTVRITNYVLPDDTLKGKVTEKSPALSTETRTFLVKVLINNRKQILHPGMFVKADIILRKKDDVIVIPKEYILSGGGNKRVYIVKQGVAHERKLVTGMESDKEVEVLKGLKENDKLVVKGFETLRDRSKVKVIQ